MYWTSTWPSNPTRSGRLRAFQESLLFGQRQVASEFWDRHAQETRVTAMPTALEVRSGFALGGPQDRASFAVPLPVGVWHRLRRLGGPAGLFAASQFEHAVARRAAAAFRPAAGLDKSLLALPAYAAMRKTHRLAPVPIYRYAAHLGSFAGEVGRRERILEIGSGSGLLSLGALELLDGSQAVLVDLPRMLPVAYSFLCHFAGDAEVVLPNEIGKDLPRARFVLLTPDQVDLIPSGSVDLALNTSSFQEMTYPIIGGYFDLIDRVARRDCVFYCANEADCRKVPGSPVLFDSYPWKDGWRVLFDREFDFGRMVHGTPMRERLVQVGGAAVLPAS